MMEPFGRKWSTRQASYPIHDASAMVSPNRHVLELLNKEMMFHLEMRASLKFQRWIFFTSHIQIIPDPYHIIVINGSSVVCVGHVGPI
jgi:hypothetical protein